MNQLFVILNLSIEIIIQDFEQKKNDNVQARLFMTLNKAHLKKIKRLYEKSR